MPDELHLALPNECLLGLQFFKDIMWHHQSDSEPATAAMKKANNHRWHPTQEPAPSTPFSSRPSTTKSVKEETAAKLPETEKPESHRRGKPVLPTIGGSTTLTDLAGPDPHPPPDAPGAETDWSSQPVDTRKEHDGHRVAEKLVRSVKVVNDDAERGVKLMYDFATQITTDPEQRGCLLQVVEYHRRKFGSFGRATLNRWCRGLVNV